MHYNAPKIEVLHHRYAQALIEVAQENNRLDKIEEDLISLNTLARTNRQFAHILYHPEIDKDDKIKLLEDVCKKFHFCPEISSFLKLLAKKNRFRLIHGVFLRYRDLYDLRKHRIKVFVRTAISLKKSQLAKLKTILKKKLNKDIFIEEIIEPSLIGGLNLKIGSLAYNPSLVDRLKLLEEDLAKI